MSHVNPKGQPHPLGFWDERYAETAYAYGSEPNDFVREVADRIPPGRALCLGEGQGRNAVFLAQRGHEVTAMDQSRTGLARAEALAAERGVKIATIAADLAGFAIDPLAFSAIVSIFVHLPDALRRQVHARVAGGLVAGGVFVFEQYGPEQGRFRSGGPEGPERRPGLETLRAEFPGLELEIAREVTREVIEGVYHTGLASTVQILARRPRA
ncbi:MAG: methyltransferase domain-containing protein [Candidatus Eisenbacteria bacterium]|nr:methyltransferase domain-containing protein [Candidatus Eisenbacteria bacterium]